MNDDDKQRLNALLSTMDVPPARCALEPNDIRWLGRNIAVRNHAHPQIDEARALLKATGAPMVL